MQSNNINTWLENENGVALKVEDLSKLFRRQKQRTFKEMLPALMGGGKKNVVDSFWALKNVSFEVKQGETFGVIGPNGSGKSTLMKILAGVTQPTSGNFKVWGKIAPLIELGAGFHPSMTGRENIYLNSIILGSTKEETTKIIDQIIDFSEIRDFIDQPVKTYSSGMYVRLAFAVAIHTQFDILLADEILAVGDESFKQKCLQKMQEFQKKGKTIILVSHDAGRIKSFCQQAIYIKFGRVVVAGNVDKVLKKYQEDISR